MAINATDNSNFLAFLFLGAWTTFACFTVANNEVLFYKIENMSLLQFPF